ncbi:Protein of unknown function [Cnuella takakiae]|uniref:DUF4197 domain-containing protein n=1 Tax=Cnuella takakiae TaxID=1302690 RepID=A0A1M5G6M8_9BACT|nr:DUF4197 domain-containing protein [Cnuella takakiae]OLY92352.1 hypothetical protein BUE76_10940 [Cnuella takakiae]SHF99460.1 Protein of unknown function [Cnuella takakiae]
MQKHWIPLLAATMFASAIHAQTIPNVFRKNGKNDSAATQVKLPNIFGKGKAGTNLSATEVSAGLKEALTIGAQRATGKLSVADGFFRDAALKILMPPEAKKLESTLRSMGMNRQVDAAILAMNRAAEDAAGSASKIFVDAVKGMTIQDALGILRGGDNAATNFLKDKTTASLVSAFQPVIGESLKKVDATRHWTTITTAYNTVSREKVNTDLTGYVTEKALAGIFLQLSQEEQSIRKDPAARTTELLKKVFQ